MHFKTWTSGKSFEQNQNVKKIIKQKIGAVKAIIADSIDIFKKAVTKGKENEEKRS